MMNALKPLIGKLTLFAKDRLSFSKPPKLFLKQSTENGNCMLGKTAHYDPNESAITVFVTNRHPKDILRSFCHELVHHCQNERGDLSPEKMKTLNKNYAQENDHMRKMEQEAYLEGNMCFRDWEDSLDQKEKYALKITEQKFLKENKNMSVKITKKQLQSLIEKLLSERTKRDSADRTSGRAAGGRRLKPLEETEELEENGCSGKREEDDEGLEEGRRCPHCEPKPGEKKASKEECICGSKEVKESKKKKPDDDGDGVPNWADKKPGKDDHAEGEKEEEDSVDEGKGHEKCVNGCYCEPPEGKEKDLKELDKIKTPEQENSLYESRFADRNKKLFEKLLNKWAK